MKKFLLIILMTALMLSSIACGTGESTADEEENTIAEETEQTEEQTEATTVEHTTIQETADLTATTGQENAPKKAKSYLQFSSFSRDSLISQLQYEGFTYEQAAYGASANGY